MAQWCQNANDVDNGQIKQKKWIGRCDQKVETKPQFAEERQKGYVRVLHRVSFVLMCVFHFFSSSCQRFERRTWRSVCV